MNWSPPKHEGNCNGTKCEVCGCCCHEESWKDCTMNDAPYGEPCENGWCGCEGGMS